MRKSILALSVAIMTLAVLSGCGDDSDGASSGSPAAGDGAAAAEERCSEDAPETVTIDHFQGTTEVPVDPETVVVADMGVLTSLDHLGIEVDGLATVGTPPEEYDELVSGPENVGTAFEPDYEAINALEPDLIIIATRAFETYGEMSKIAPTIDLTPATGDDVLASFRDVHESIGTIFCVEEEVEAAMAEIDAGIAEVEAQTPDAGDALVVMTAGSEVSAFGPGSRFGAVYDVYGYGAADEGLERDATHGDIVSFEYINEAAPDAMIVVDRSAATGEEGDSAEAILDNDLVTSTPAWQNDRVVFADPWDWYIIFNSIPGVLQATEDVAASLP